MFRNTYPLSKLRRPRALPLLGRFRGTVVTPKPFGVPPPELVHIESCIVPMPTGGKAFVIEWTGGTVERHLADI